MSFIDHLPRYYGILKTKTAELEHEIRELWAKLDDGEDEEIRDHSCDCEYCPYADYVPKPVLTASEYSEVEGRLAKLEDEKRECVLYTLRLERYAKLWKVEL